MKQIDFIRHGMPRLGRMYRGSTIDDPLSEHGWQQMWQAVGTDMHWQLIVSSPLRRCLEFAQALARRDGGRLVVEHDFREVGFGTWEGLTPAEVQRADPTTWAAFHLDPVNCRPKGAEELDAFGARVARAFSKTLEACGENESALVVAHAGVIRAALGHVMQAPPNTWYRVRVDNAGLSRFRQDARGLQLVFHNCPRLPRAAVR